MNPLFAAALGSIIRWGLGIGAGLLIEHGIWTNSEASVYIGAATMAIVALAWSLWQKYGARLKFVTAAAMPAGVSEKHVESVISSGIVPLPPTTLPKHEVIRPLKAEDLGAEPLPLLLGEEKNKKNSTKGGSK